MFALAYTFLPIIAYKTKNPRAAIPLVPISFVIAFQYDMLYGNMNIRVQREAARLIKEEPERFFLPEGNGFVTHKEYKEFVGIPQAYKPRITLNSRYGHLESPLPVNIYHFDQRKAIEREVHVEK